MTDENDWLCDGKNVLDKIDLKLFRNLVTAMTPIWETVFDNIELNPRIDRNNLKNEIKQNIIIKKRNPAEDMMFALARRDVRKKHLRNCFEKIQFEEGLKLLDKPLIPMHSERMFEEKIQVNENSRLELRCNSIGFPYPKHVYYKHGNPTVYECNPLVFEKISANDAGLYTCRITQGNPNEFIEFQTKIEVNLIVYPDLSISISPSSLVQYVGKSATLKAIIPKKYENENIKYQWFKETYDNQTESININTNPTAQSREFTIEKLKMCDTGKYTCKITLGVTELYSRKKCKVIVKPQSNFDLKIALVIMNGDYQRINSCKKCKDLEEDEGYSYAPLKDEEKFNELKRNLEDSNFLVMGFNDLESDTFLRCVKLFREIIEPAKNILIFMYIAGHGFHKDTHDFLVPSDIQEVVHEKEHPSKMDRLFMKETYGVCSLATILENFVSDKSSLGTDKRFSVVCFWDLCREIDIKFSTDSYASICKNLKYSIVYSCNVGESAYGESSIVLRYFLESFNKYKSLQEILISINKKIRKERAKGKQKTKNDKITDYSVLEVVKLHSTLENQNFLSIIPKNNDIFKTEIDQLYLNETETGYKTDSFLSLAPNQNIVLKFEYKFERDIFLNTVLLDLRVVNRRDVKLDVVAESPKIRIKRLKENENKFRVKGIQNIQDFLRLKVIYFQIAYCPIELDLRNCEFLKRIRSDTIEEYVNDKKKIKDPFKELYYSPSISSIGPDNNSDSQDLSDVENEYDDADGGDGDNDDNVNENSEEEDGEEEDDDVNC